MDHSRPESKSRQTYTWVKFDESDNNNYYDENDFKNSANQFHQNNPKSFGRSNSMPTGQSSTPITISTNSKIDDKTEESIFHQWAKLENSFTNNLDSVTTSTPKSITRRRPNSESSFTSSIDASLNLEKDNFWTRPREEQKKIQT